MPNLFTATASATEKGQNKNTLSWDFPGGPVAGLHTPHVCVCVGGVRFHPWLGNWIPYVPAMGFCMLQLMIPHALARRFRMSQLLKKSSCMPDKGSRATIRTPVQPNKQINIKTRKRNPGSPRGSVIKNLPADAGDTVCWSRKIPHTEEQLSPCAVTTEPVL